MKKKFLLLAALTMSGLCDAQIAKWLIPSAYDGIRIANGADIIITDSVNERILWTMDGKRLGGTADNIYSFVEERAVAVKRESAVISGFYNDKGAFTPLENCQVAHGYPYFSDNNLLVTDGVYFRYVDKEGHVGDRRYVRAYPYSNGYASCFTYENVEKRKSPFNLLVDTDQKPVTLSYNGKNFDADDVDFISSVNDEKIGIVVIKKKLYFIDARDLSLSPVYATKDEVNSKNQGKLDGELSTQMMEDTDSTSVLWAKCGKAGRVVIRFDKMLVPLSIMCNEVETVYKRNTTEERKLASPLGFSRGNDLFGLSWDSDEMLPPQFDKIGACFGDKAFVMLSGKWGMLKVLKDKRFGLSVNKGNDIGFRHRKFETILRLEVPTDISARNTRVAIDPKTGCEVDMTSGTWKDTDFGNHVEYSCVLNIPQSLPDEMFGDERNEIEYPAQVYYDGLKSSLIPFKVKAWHYKYLTAEIPEGERMLQHGLYSFTFNINADRMPGEVDVPIDVKIQTDSLTFSPDKISETRYRCKDLQLNEGVNNISIVIQEQGCPPISFPYEFYYTKPSARARTKEKVEVKEVKKKPVKVTTPPAPHWDI